MTLNSLKGNCADPVHGAMTFGRKCLMAMVFVVAPACGNEETGPNGTPVEEAGGGSGNAGGTDAGQAGGGAGSMAGAPGGQGDVGGAAAGGAGVGGGSSARIWRGTRPIQRMPTIDAMRLRSGAIIVSSENVTGARIARFAPDQTLNVRDTGDLMPERAHAYDHRYIGEDSGGNIGFVSLIGGELESAFISMGPDLGLRWVYPIGEGGKLVGVRPDGTTWLTRFATTGLEFVRVGSDGGFQDSFILEGAALSDSMFVGLKSDGTLFVLSSPIAGDATLRTFDGTAIATSTCTGALDTLLDWDDDSLLVSRQGNLALLSFDCDERWSTARELDYLARLQGSAVASYGRTGSMLDLRVFRRTDGEELWHVDVGMVASVPQTGYGAISLEAGADGIGGLALGGYFRTEPTEFVPFLLRVDDEGNILFRRNAPIYPATTGGLAALAVPDQDGGTLAVMSDMLVDSYVVRWDPEGNVDHGNVPSANLYCFDATNRICTEIDNLEESTFEAFLAECRDRDGGIFTLTSCAAQQEAALLCDGTNFDIQGQSVNGRAHFLEDTTLSCVQMTNACGAASGTIAAGCNSTALAPQRDHSFECPSGDVHYVLVASATAECQLAQELFAETYVCNRIADFEAALAGYETCFPPVTE